MVVTCALLLPLQVNQRLSAERLQALLEAEKAVRAQLQAEVEVLRAQLGSGPPKGKESEISLQHCSAFQTL
jgi:hypothetical protein